jgi:HK97 family phage portal protein
MTTNFLSRIIPKFANHKNKSFYSNLQAYITHLDTPAWTNRDFPQFVEEAYKKNVVANRCINLIASSAASVDWLLYLKTSKNKEIIKQHKLLELLKKPNPLYAGAEFFENIFAYKLLSGNAYILAVKSKYNEVKELYFLRPDRVEVVPGKHALPAGYIYKIGENKKFYPVDSVTGQSQILHIKNFHPLDDWYGLSQIEAASYSIDLHNQATKWNQSLLQNGARPSGALILKSDRGVGTDVLTADQFERLKEEMREQFSSSQNAGKPLLLEGGLQWQEMSLTPKDMDFIESKNNAARDIALAFGVPPQLLAIKGDNSYNNMQEARLAFWEETILPLLDHTIDSLNNWLVTQFDHNLELSYDHNAISALSLRQEKNWQRIQNATFMTINEKRAAVGLPPIANGENLS